MINHFENILRMERQSLIYIFDDYNLKKQFKLYYSKNPSAYIIKEKHIKNQDFLRLICVNITHIYIFKIQNLF